MSSPKMSRTPSDDLISGNSLSSVRNRNEGGRGGHQHVRDTPSKTPTLSNHSCLNMMDSLVVKNERVRYYYNTTLATSKPIRTMIDSLSRLHSYTFAYLSQYPASGDYSVISTLFELIPTIFTMIDWDNMNHSCYWEDLCRETKQLFFLLEKVNGAALKCGDTITEVFTQAQVLFHGILPDERNLHVQRAINFRQTADYLNDEPDGQSIRVSWSKPGDNIELSWYDADGGLFKVLLKQTGAGFRLRFLRHIIYHARTCLEFAYMTFSKLNVALHLDVPLAKLEKCHTPWKQLSAQEHALIYKAKQNFDDSLDVLWTMIYRFKFQTFQLLKYKSTFKGLRKSWLFIPKTEPTFKSITMTVDGSLLMRVMSFRIQAQAKDESFDFTVFPDRTEDIISKIEDLLVVDYSSFTELQTLINIVKSTLSSEKRNFTDKELASIKGEIRMLLSHRVQIRRYLKQSLNLFENHAAFQKMKQNFLIPTKSSSLKRQSESYLDESSTDASATCLEEAENIRNNNYNNVDHIINKNSWVGIPGEIQVTMDVSKGVLAKFPVDDSIRTFADLSTDEKVVLNVRLIRKLLSFCANEQCNIKILLGRVTETKSLVKRLKLKDRMNDDLQNTISEHCKFIRAMLQLTKTMRFLKLAV